MKTPWEIELIKPEQKWEITLSNKVSYVLPIASPEQLGGVKPDGKTSDMDIPVAVDEEGKLWTKDKIDETLSIKGFSADAAAVGEALKNIKVDGFVSYTEQTLTDEQKAQARENIGAGMPQIQSDWNQNDENAVDYVKNKPDITTDDEIIDMLTENDMLPVVADSDGAILADESDNILLW